MVKPTNFRRAKLVKFIQDQERLIRETSEQLRKLGNSVEGYQEPRNDILSRLKDEFDITPDELE